MTTSSTSGVQVPLPPMRLRLMMDDDESFLRSGQGLVRILRGYGFADDDALLDVGCGVGRLPIALLATTSFRGHYRGFDVSRRHVRWAKRSLTPIAPDMTFRHLDVRNDRYNPEGAIAAAEARFPARTEGYDVACLFSVFTHMYRGDTQLYLHELHRVLKPGGRVVASWFLYDDATYESAVEGAFPMVHRLDEHTIYHEAEDPLRAIAFHEDEVREMIAAAGLEIERVDYGHWSRDRNGEQFQDHLLLRRPELTTAQRLRRRAGSLKRRVLGRG
ncbi:class I SAM-dependent methyltransferase [Nocardioides sp. CER19]|uniref:class I SAM-dependent methyltransferase n=1 Tax=Nocardioides sp. CER19 TaxID=3038538 RepID=UPI00244C2A8B|nr:class I SAM-dependent methyltransferase [Nocardioides sp. CER19]MDH2416920.1 class I SAM-dependent methyltransferase [Nocardioides sp. CER19]